MTKANWSIYKNTTIYGILLTALLVWAHCGPRISYAVFGFNENIVEDRTYPGNSTSTDYRFPDQFENTLEKYTNFKNMYCAQFSTAIPGLEYTNVGNSYSTQMIPQGICIVKDYMLITAYDYARVEKSVIYVLTNQDETNRELLTTIVLPDKNHVGGITFDGERIWLAKSSTGYCSVIPYWQLELAILQGKENYVLEKYQENVFCGKRASFVTYYEKRLWIGTYCGENHRNSMLTSYQIRETQGGMELIEEAIFEIPPYAQGVSFAEGNDGSYMIVTTSSGRYNNSLIHVFKFAINDSRIKLTWTGRCVFPPMAQGLVSTEKYTYLLFESAATCYSSRKYQRCVHPVDRVCAIFNGKLLQSF